VSLSRVDGLTPPVVVVMPGRYVVDTTINSMSQDERRKAVLAAASMRLVDEGEGAVAVPDAEMPPLTAGLVRDTLVRVRQ
jgi:hypothetical protein